MKRSGRHRPKEYTEAEMTKWDFSCIYCGARQSDHLGAQNVCPHRFVSVYRRCWPDEVAGWDCICDLVSASHLFVPRLPAALDGVWCERCGGHARDPIHQGSYL